MIYLVVGTRPEVLKMAPIVRALKNLNEPYALVVIRQHEELLDQALKAEDMEPDLVVTPKKVRGGDLAADFGGLHEAATLVLSGHQPRKRSLVGKIPDLVLVQGDTNTALAGALAAWHLRIPVGHVEAGLRSSKRDRPFPEDGNRRLISQLAEIHFCPTRNNADRLDYEGVEGLAHITGNTSIDQLRRSTDRYDINAANGLVPPVDEDNRPWVFVTVHRRENLEHLEEITEQIHKFAAETSPSDTVWPVHPNSHVPYASLPCILDNLHLIPPVTHDRAVCGIRFADLVVTDSGGVVEEATSLGKRILVLRDETERPEAIESGHARLVPASEYGTLAARMAEALLLPAVPPSDVFGDGHAGERIAELAAEFVRRRLAS